MGSWSYSWSKHKIDKPTDIPDFPHYAVMVYRDLHYTLRGYDRTDPDESCTVRVSDYYAFAEGDKDLWQKMLKQIFTERTKTPPSPYANSENEDVVFFHSSGRGKVEIQVDVNVKLEDA